MVDATAGLELPIGVTEQKFAQQLARIEAKAISAAKKMEGGFVAANKNIVRSTEGMSGAARANLQNVNFQLQDVFVQIQSGTDASRALAQQVPQLLGGFGALGAVLGTVAAVAIPLAAQFISFGDGTDALADATKNAEEALANYSKAMENANISAAELTARYGEAAGAAREFLNILAETARAQDILAQRDALAAVQQAYSGVINEAKAYQSAIAAGNAMAQEGFAEQFSADYGLAIDQATRLAEILDEINNASDASQRNSLLQEMAGILNEAVANGGDVNAEMLTLVENASNAALAVLSIDNANLSGAMAQVDALSSKLLNLIAKANSAAAALNAAGVFVGSDGSIQTGARGRDPSTDWRFEDPNKDYDTLKERRAREAAEKAAAAAREAKLLTGGSGGSKSKGKGRAGAREKDETTLSDILGDAGRDITALERQITLIGKSTEETARLRAQWEMLDAAKKAGIPVTDQMNAQIEAQAAQVAQLTVALEQAELAQQQFDDAMDGIADAFTNALVEGESLREGLADVFKGIAADLLKFGIRQALMASFGGMGGGSWLSRLFGGADPLTNALAGAGALVSYDGGGFTGHGARSGGLDGKGGRLSVVHPNETILDHTKGQGMGGLTASFAPSIHLNPGVTQADLAMAMAAARREYEQKFLPMLRKNLPKHNERYA